MLIILQVIEQSGVYKSKNKQYTNHIQHLRIKFCSEKKRQFFIPLSSPFCADKNGDDQQQQKS